MNHMKQITNFLYNFINDSIILNKILQLLYNLEVFTQIMAQIKTISLFYRQMTLNSSKEQ
ncbi:hypothetical protein pb186bvf_015621 [Paramecium bursaria]